MRLRALGKAILVGTFAGAFAPTIFTAWIGLTMLNEENGLASALYFITMPAVVAFCFVLTCAVLIGLPVTFVLRALKQESPTTYAIIGGMVGFAMPMLAYWFVGEEFSFLLPLFGAFSGSVTGWMWGSEQEAVVDGHVD